MKSVELIHVAKSYVNGIPVVKNLNVKINPGEFFVLVGPSGCGKSTILRMIAGIESITDGILKIGEETANLLPPSKRSLSMVFQNYALYPHLTASENITFGLEARHLEKKLIEKRLGDTAEMLDLSPYLDRKPRELSGGQRQRVALARSIVSEAPICLMDEPLSNLDAKLRARMRSEIRQIQKRIGITMIYVTHDQIEAMTMGDRMMVIRDGEQQQTGRPIDVYNHPANTFVASFIGSPQMNLIRAVYNPTDKKLSLPDGFQIPFQELSSPTNEFILGIRPEKIRPVQSAIPHAIRWVINVDYVEILGNETLLSFTIASSHWISKWEGQWTISAGTSCTVAIDPSDIILFDPESRERVFDQKRASEGTEATV